MIIFPVTGENQIILIKQYRHGVGEICVDYPGGAIDKNQSIYEVASHELYEETGYIASRLIRIGPFYNGFILFKPINSFCSSPKLRKKAGSLPPKRNYRKYFNS